METKEKIETILSQCWGTEGYRYTPILKAAGMVYTNGIRTLTNMADCWWLIGAIASYQSQAIKDCELSYKQFWTLTVHEDKSATLICERDTDDIIFTQKIDYTDFPLPEIKIWLEAGQTSYGKGNTKRVMVAMLPNER